MSSELQLEDQASHPRWGATFRNIAVASIFSAILVVIASLAMVVEPWLIFRRLGGIDYIPSLIAIEVVRGWGPWGAAIVTCMHVTAVLHAPGWPQHRIWIAAGAAISVPLFYVPVGTLAIGTAMVTTRVALGLAPAEYFRFIESGDVAWGVVTALLLGIVPLAWTFACKPLFLAAKRSLAAELGLTWLCMVVLSSAVAIVKWALARP